MLTTTTPSPRPLGPHTLAIAAHSDRALPIQTVAAGALIGAAIISRAHAWIHGVTTTEQLVALLLVSLAALVLARQGRAAAGQTVRLPALAVRAATAQSLLGLVLLLLAR